jgi:RimJ/RimL family protein N-acetyltransferase
MEKYPKTVKLKNGVMVKLKILQADELELLVEFFQSLPLEDRMYLRSDVMKKEYIMRRFGHMNYDVMYPIIAMDNDKIIAIGTLFRAEFGWMRNLGEIRSVVSPKYQRNGLCTILVRELFLHAVSKDLFKVQAEIMEEQKSALKAFERMGFKKEAILKNHVTDIKGQRRNLVIMSLDIEELWTILEDHTIGKQYVV